MRWTTSKVIFKVLLLLLLSIMMRWTASKVIFKVMLLFSMILLGHQQGDHQGVVAKQVCLLTLWDRSMSLVQSATHSV